MKKILTKGFVILLLASMILMAFMPQIAQAIDNVTLEKSHKWLTGDQSYVMAIATEDIDGDNVKEIVTVGFFHDPTQPPEVQPCWSGEIAIWNWNGLSITLEQQKILGIPETWSNNTRLNALAIGNVDDDNKTEIVVAGYGKLLGVTELGLLSVYNWNGTHLQMKTGRYWPEEPNATRFWGLAIGDIDQDNVTEIVAVGDRNMTSWYGMGRHGVLTIWNVTDSNLMLEKNTEFSITLGAEGTYCEDVSVNDVDGDGKMEIVIVGEYRDSFLDIPVDSITLPGYAAMIRTYYWNGTQLYLERNHHWYTYGSTYGRVVATCDLDLDGTIEIVTGGEYWNGEETNGQLTVWSGDNLMPEANQEWDVSAGPVEVHSLAIGDVDDDGIPEIITGGWPWQFRIWSKTGNTIVLEKAKSWNGFRIYGIAIDDVDDDGVKEILTVGYAVEAAVEKSLLEIWSVSKVASSITLNLNLQNIVIGSQVTMSGHVTNETDETPIPNVEVTIEISYEMGAFTPLATVVTDENGEYTFTWIPPSAGSYVIRASWKGDFEYDGASDTETLTVEKASSMVTLTLSSYTAKIGDTANVDGALYPAKATTITIKYTMPNGTIVSKTASSDSMGIFNDVFNVNQAGKWTVKASWTGDDVHKATESASTTLTVTKIQSTLSITASSLTASVGEEVTISGTLTPAQTATVTITYTMPNGTTTTKTVESTSEGRFTDVLKVEQDGVCRISASWNGNEQTEAATSFPLTIIAQTVDLITPILAITGLGLGVIALIIAVAGIYMLLRKKKEVPPSTPTPASTQPPTSPAAPQEKPPTTPSETPSTT